MFRGLFAVLLVPIVDLATLVAYGLGRAANLAVLSLLTLALTQALDLVTFTAMVGRHGAAAEANPLVAGLYGTYGVTAVVAAKVALVVLIGALSVSAWARGRRGTWSVVGGVPLALAIAAGLIGGITNAAAYLS